VDLERWVQRTGRVGLVGLGAMGRALAGRLASLGVPLQVFDTSPEAVAAVTDGPAAGSGVAGAATLAELVSALPRPRVVFLLLPAGDAVEAVSREMEPHLGRGDLIVDAGNSHYADTSRRARRLGQRGILWMGLGLSGGPEGARHGPALMAGGSRAAWDRVAPLLTSLAARALDGVPCATWVGPEGAGHFAKMVHNGIEYAEMQILAEAWMLLNRGLGYPHAAVAAVFDRWNRGRRRSYLLELGVRVLATPDEQGRPLIDRVRDVAGASGTGRWTVEAALRYGVALPTVEAAVGARLLSSPGEEREQLRGSQRVTVEVSRRSENRQNGDPAPFLAAARCAMIGGEARKTALFRGEGGWDIPPECLPRRLVPCDGQALLGADPEAAVAAAVEAGRWLALAEGFRLLRAAARAEAWPLDAARLARAWRAGCILRCAALEPLAAALAAQPELPSLLLDPEVQSRLSALEAPWRQVVAFGAQGGVPVPALAAALHGWDALRTVRQPAALVQALRDAFGYHGFERVDDSQEQLGRRHHDAWRGK
jgi:6-phosphogluconate dehydrogenase